MSSFEELEDTPGFEEQSFFLESLYPELKYRFWVGPDRIDLARAVKRQCGPNTRRRNNNQSAQDPYPEHAFSDPNHEAFYQWCLRDDAEDSELNWLFNSPKRSQIAEDDLRIAENDIRRHLRIQNLMQSEQGIREELQRIQTDHEGYMYKIDEEIANLQAVKLKKDTRYNNTRKPLEERLRQIVEEREESNVKSDTDDDDDDDGSSGGEESDIKKPRLSGLYCAQCHHLKKGGGG
jgi:hypothetical protein